MPRGSGAPGTNFMKKITVSYSDGTFPYKQQIFYVPTLRNLSLGVRKAKEWCAERKVSWLHISTAQVNECQDDGIILDV